MNRKNRLLALLAALVLSAGIMGCTGSPADDSESTIRDIPSITPESNPKDVEEDESGKGSKGEEDSEPEEEAEEPGSENEDKTEDEDNIPTEYKSALKKAMSYSKNMHMSKSAIYDQLVSEYGEKFSEDAAQYAMENIEVDWKENALAKAESYSKNMHMSKEGVYDQLVSEYGEGFTEEEASYAVDNLDADWKENALKKAESYQ